MVWVHRQGQWKGKYFSLSFSEEVAKKLRVVLQMRHHETLLDSLKHYEKIGDMMRHYETARDTMRHYGCNGTL